MVFEDKTAVHCEKYKKHVNIRTKYSLPNCKPGGAYSNHCTLNGYNKTN